MSALRWPQIAVLVLALGTAAIHLSLAVPQSLVGFYLNALGYLVLAGGLLWVPAAGRRRFLLWALYGYTILTIVLWIALGERTVLALVDKVIELMLLVILWREREALTA